MGIKAALDVTQWDDSQSETQNGKAHRLVAGERVRLSSCASERTLASDADDPLVLSNAEKQKLAEAFGRRYGWSLSRRPFGLKQLSERKPATRRDWFKDFRKMDRFSWDHPYFFRELNPPFRPAALYAICMAAGWATKTA